MCTRGESLYSWLVVLTVHSEMTFCLEGWDVRDYSKDEGPIYKTKKTLISKNRRAVMKGIASWFKILKILWFMWEFPDRIFWTSKLDRDKTCQAEYRVTTRRKTLKNEKPSPAIFQWCSFSPGGCLKSRTSFPELVESSSLEIPKLSWTRLWATSSSWTCSG